MQLGEWSATARQVGRRKSNEKVGDPSDIVEAKVEEGRWCEECSALAATMGQSTPGEGCRRQRAVRLICAAEGLQEGGN